jgi:quercetin dioxygenase-like cupin family protein
MLANIASIIYTRMSTIHEEIIKSEVHHLVNIIDYVPNAIVSKTIIKKPTGNITLMSFDSGKELAEKPSPFDTFVQIIEGAAEITINKKVHILQWGEGIIIPAHASRYIKANQRFKMLLTIIKSGYEA